MVAPVYNKLIKMEIEFESSRTLSDIFVMVRNVSDSDYAVFTIAIDEMLVQVIERGAFLLHVQSKYLDLAWLHTIMDDISKAILGVSF